VLILTTYDEDQYLYDALRAGASGFLLKDTKRDDLTRAIRTVAAGDALLHPTLTKRLMDRFTRSPAPVPGQRLPELTDRENDVLLLVARGRQQRDRGRAVSVRVNSQDAPRQHHPKTAAEGPRTGRRSRLRTRRRRPRRVAPPQTEPAAASTAVCARSCAKAGSFDHHPVRGSLDPRNGNRSTSESTHCHRQESALFAAAPVPRLLVAVEVLAN
jgi:hypothetical protein